MAPHLLRSRAMFAAGFALLFALAQCMTPGSSGNAGNDAGSNSGSDSAGAGEAADPRALAAWDVVYRVLQHPRCVNCHPAGDVPFQGDIGRPHAQNVQRGPDGKGLFAMRCDACHQETNVPGLLMPPGAPNWHLPSAEMPLVFEGMSSGDLCRQLLDRKRNGNKTTEELHDHIAKDALVLWGWDPGDGRAPVSIPHAQFVAAMRTWIDAGCGCPQ